MKTALDILREFEQAAVAWARPKLICHARDIVEQETGRNPRLYRITDIFVSLAGNPLSGGDLQTLVIHYFACEIKSRQIGESERLEWFTTQDGRKYQFSDFKAYTLQNITGLFFEVESEVPSRKGTYDIDRREFPYPII
jgi:hypothetical protein